MKPTKILALVGGNSRDSLNQKLFHALEKMSPTGCGVHSFDLATLPFFSKDLEKELPAAVADLKQKIEEADALIFVTPEYNRSIPAILKNAIDWGSRPEGKNSWKKKRAGVLGASVGNLGTCSAQSHLRQILVAVDVQVMTQPETYLNAGKAFDDQGQLIDAGIKSRLEKYWTALEEFVGSSNRE